jgi:hypothetical protein
LCRRCHAARARSFFFFFLSLIFLTCQSPSAQTRTLAARGCRRFRDYSITSNADRNRAGRAPPPPSLHHTWWLFPFPWTLFFTPTTRPSSEQ